MNCQDCTEFPKVEIKDLEQKCKYCSLHGPPILWAPFEGKQKTKKVHTHVTKKGKAYTITKGE